ncbi:MAG: YicC/YloC family endoribonuclease [Bacteroidota bacterium]
MLLSMTGYGRGKRANGGRTFLVELRSLNSKQTDLRLRSPQNLGQYELQLRKQVTEFAMRGKLEMNIDIRHEKGDDGVSINLPLLQRLFSQVNDETSFAAGSNPEALLAGLVRLPNVVETKDSELSEEQWEALRGAALDCLEHFQQYRRQEGEVMANDLRTSAQAIKNYLEQVPPFENARVERVRERLNRQLEEFQGRQNVDQSRYEQEVLYYLEKIDINEEKVRLAQNCDYFLEILDNENNVKGRKLSFISQEIGREINTLGAKAHSADIQRLVVDMKEQLEQIKEQLANVV